MRSIPVQFRLKRHISAERARWEPSISKWVFQNGRSRDMDPKCPACPPIHADNFTDGTRTFPELEETPDYFLQEVQAVAADEFPKSWRFISPSCSRAASIRFRYRWRGTRNSRSRYLL